MNKKDDVTKLLERLVCTHGESRMVRDVTAMVATLVDEHAALRVRNDKLEWLLAVERFWYSHPGNGSCWWDSIEREHSTAEAKAIWKAALDECKDD